MPVPTEHYMLEAFLDGDALSAIVEKRRFSTVDNQLNAMSTIIGDGRIDGWEIVPQTFPNVRVTKGSGFIDKHYVATFEDKDFELAADSSFNFYAQRRVGIIGTEGPRSDLVSITYSDDGPPAAPTGFSTTTPNDDPYFTVQLDWDANSEIDFDHYEIERTTEYPPDNYTAVTTTTDTAYIDRLSWCHGFFSRS